MRDHPEEFLEPNGFVYHETRTGSTLVANMLAHVPSNLVLSENNVAEDPARHCHQCTDAQKVLFFFFSMCVCGWCFCLNRDVLRTQKRQPSTSML